MRKIVFYGLVGMLFFGCSDSSKSSNSIDDIIVKDGKISLEEDSKKITLKKIDIVEVDYQNKINNLSDKLSKIYHFDNNITWQESDIKVDFKSAEKYCKKLNFTNDKSWSLATMEELKKLNKDGYWSSVEEKGDKKSIICVKSGELLSLNFNSYIKFRSYIANLYSKNNDLENKKFFVENKYGTLDQHLYTRNIFPEINRLAQDLVNIYSNEAKTEMPYIPTEIVKPIIPEISNVIDLDDRDKKIKSLQSQFRIDVENRNEIIKNIISKYKSHIEKFKIKEIIKEERLSQKIKEFQKGAFKTVMGTFRFIEPKYDEKTQLLSIIMNSSRSDYKVKASVNLSPQLAKSFENNISIVDIKAIFDFNDTSISLKSINAEYKDKKYLVKIEDKDLKSNSFKIITKDKKRKFKTIKQLNLSLQNPNLQDMYSVELPTYSDDIPQLLKKYKQTKIDTNKWLITIGIENYTHTDKIVYARRSAKLFKEVAKKTLGIQENNCFTLIDNVTSIEIIQSKIEMLLSQAKQGDTIYFYYNGHSITDSNNSESYILPYNKIPDFIVDEKMASLNYIYKKLSTSKNIKVISFMDSSLNGITDEVNIFKGVNNTFLSTEKMNVENDNIFILSTTTSNMYAEKGHRAFSYFLMKSLLSNEKDINKIYDKILDDMIK